MKGLTLRVTSVRSNNPKGFGGCIFSGREIDDSGNVLNAKTLYVVVASHDVINGVEVQDGQWWAISGPMEARRVNRDGYIYTEYQIIAVSAQMRRISGRHIVGFLAAHVPGMGWVKALRLWEAYGEKLYEYLDVGNVKKLGQVVSVKIAMELVKFWEVEGDTTTLQWLQNAGIDVKLGQKLIGFYKRDTVAKIEGDPYRLLAFDGDWRRIDAFALDRLGVKEDDPRRLQGAIEESLYQLFDKGHTAAPMQAIEQRLKRLLGLTRRGKELINLISDCLDHGFTNGSYAFGATGLLHAVGPMYMESYVAEFCANRVNTEKRGTLLPSHIVDVLLNEHELEQSIELTAEQRQAVHLANRHGLAVITGGAGTGKTTVLQALYKVYDAASVDVVQMALPGKASMRMAEATGRSARTIASWLKGETGDDLVDRPASMTGPLNLKERVLVIDEASMLDIMTMYLLCRAVGNEGRVVMTGDPSQLMPVGPGLILHELDKTPGIPVVHLKTVKRYGGMIAQVANAVRNGRWLDLPASADKDISFIPCSAAAAVDVAMALYDKDPKNTQILNARRRGPDGVLTINARCQQRYTSHSTKVEYLGEEPDGTYYTGFNQGDPVICTVNRWDTGMLNGSTGRVSATIDRPYKVLNKQGEVLGTAIAEITWDDGETRPMMIERLDDLELAYAITVHKSQGSQWPIVLVVLTRNRLLDRTLIYTAITRARTKVVMVGDLAAARAAVEALPKHTERTVALGDFLRQMMPSPTNSSLEQLPLLATVGG
jgi:exodeoxyribonuclease V alpha subunit